MESYVRPTFSAEETRPSRLADAFEGLGAAAVLAARQGDALVAHLPAVADAAPALPRALAVAVHGITSPPAHRHLAEIPLPPREALEVALLVADVVHVLLLFLGFLTGL